MKRLVYIISVMIALANALPALAVTDKEMEQARVIATQTYLRYANDGSGYLDALHPSTMAQLERSLKPKEKENIKAFKAIPVPTDYASWDKQKLVDYWSNTAYSQAGLLPKGKVGKNPTRKKLNAMTIAVAAAATTTASTTPATTTPAAQAKTSEAKDAAQAQATAQAAKSPDITPAAKPSTINLDSAQAELDEARMLAEAALDADEDGTIPKETTHTWIYVLILCILVAVVVGLVVFASNVMKKSAGTANFPVSPAQSDEIKTLLRKLKESENRVEEEQRQNKILRKKVDALTAEIDKMRSRPSTSQQPPIQGIPRPKPVGNALHQPVSAQSAQAPGTTQPQTSPASHPHSIQTPAAASTTSATATPTPTLQTSSQPHLRTIYLGRANADGVFVRADRTFNAGNSVYRLDTTDGVVGSFKIVSDPSVIEKVIENPARMLSAGCVGPDLDTTDDLQKIVTDSAGTAIFQEDRWIVRRKAKIHYER